jgi:hypothetical protein
MRLPAAFKFNGKKISAAYVPVRARLAKDPLFIKAATKFDVSLAQLDTRMQRIPKSSAKVYQWLDGADQYRYAGLAILFEAYGRSAAPLTYAQPMTVGSDRCVFFAGDVTIHGALTLGASAIVIVLGTLRIHGPLIAPDDYTLVAAERIEFAGGTTSGELIALTTIIGGTKVYLAGNDYSCRAKTFEAEILVDFERNNGFGKVRAKKRINTWSFAKAAKALGVSTDDDLQAALVALLQGNSASTSGNAQHNQDVLWEAARQSASALAKLLPGTWDDQQRGIALQHATEWDQPAAVKLLLRHGARAHAQAALHLATNSVAITDLLLDATDGKSECANGDQPLLHVACNIGSTAVITRLIARGFDVNVADQQGVTALHVCAWRGQVANAKLLLKHGAAKDRKTTAAWHDFAAKGATPLDVAHNQLKRQKGAKPWRDLVAVLS